MGIIRKKLINDTVNASWKSYNDIFLKYHGIDCHCIYSTDNDTFNKHHLWIMITMTLIRNIIVEHFQVK